MSFRSFRKIREGPSRPLRNSSASAALALSPALPRSERLGLPNLNLAG